MPPTLPAMPHTICPDATVTASDYRAFLRRFHDVPDAVYDLVLDELQPVHCRRGELLVPEGSVERDLYFVYSGLQIAYFNNDGQEHVVTFSYPMSLAGIPDSFLLQQPSEYAIRALTDSHLGCISYARLNELFDQSQPLERLFRKMIEAKFIGLITRYKELQTCSMEERFRRFAERSAPLLRLVPHKYLASYLRIAPSNFSTLYNSVRI